MTVSKAKSAKITGSGFRAIAWVLLLAFTLQSFITQVHIHGTIGGGAAAVETLGSGLSHSKNPAQNDTSDCPLCQAITHAGAFSAPSAPVLALPVSLAETAAPILLAGAIGTISPHPWHSRAPPRS
jgi:hypothetical protein